MTRVLDIPVIQSVVAERLEANKWTPQSFAQYVRFHIDGEEGDGDGISSRINAANAKLRSVFKKIAPLVGRQDISEQINNFKNGAPDWLPALDIAQAMIEARPQVLTLEHVNAVRKISELPVTKKEIRPIAAQKFLDALKL